MLHHSPLKEMFLDDILVSEASRVMSVKSRCQKREQKTNQEIVVLKML
jgi:hypothetical protein